MQFDSRSALLVACASALEESDLDYCVLHGWELLPGRIDSDVDMVIDTTDVRAVLRVWTRTVAGTNARLVQVIQHEAYAWYCVLALSLSTGHEYLHLDWSSDYRREGRILMSGSTLLEGRRRKREFWVPSPSSEWLYYVTKRALKRDLRAVHVESLPALDADERAALSRKAVGLLSADGVTAVTGVLEVRESQEQLQGVAEQIRSDVLVTTRRRYISRMRYALMDTVRRVARVARPTGLAVVVYGLDGVGKSTVIEHLTEVLAPAFRRTVTSHLFYGDTPRGVPVLPHQKPTYGAIKSVLKLGYLWMRWLSGAAKGRDAKVHSTLVVQDRGVVDLVVDPERFRVRLPRWGLRAAAATLPGPDVAVWLDAPYAVVAERKLELSSEAFDTRRRVFTELVTKFDIQVVDATGDARTTSAAVVGIVEDALAERIRRRYGVI